MKFKVNILTILMPFFFLCCYGQGCDNATQCFLNETLLDPLVNCSVAPFGPTDHPCYGHWSSASSCSCSAPYYRISSYGAVYWCNDNGEFDSDLYALSCFGSMLYRRQR
ncbi:hypothetical protein HOLleu_37088 [Holothuria leucospilota]|uniref:Uncharacterized protein n=1 Tax=Holothuria leucospilota TaxID=206669 RepID=A0A9Q1BF14_HOLLE|nr:hypothetical protein HOLleu_37088 [Holothuria leucospilota]